MIRSSQVPSLLHRIKGDGILEAMLVTPDGELLGTSYRRQSEEHADRATLITDICLDYIRLGNEFNQHTLTYMELNMSQGTIGVAHAGPECFCMLLGSHTVPSGLLKKRTLACASHVRDSLMPLTDAPS